MRTHALIVCTAVALIATPALATPPEPPHWLPDGSPVVTAAGDQYGIAAAPFKSGGILVAWSDGRRGNSGEADIYAQALTAQGAVDPFWPYNGIQVSTEPGWHRDVSVVTDAGGAYVAWLGQSDAVHLQRLTNQATIATGWPAGGLLVAAAPWPDSHRMAPDGTGGVFIAWVELEGGARIQRITMAGAPAPGWPAEGISLGVGQTASVALLADGFGGCFVVWSTRVDRAPARATVQRFAADGTLHPSWPSAGVMIGIDLNIKDGYELIPDELGGVFVAWTEALGICLEFMPCGDQKVTRLDGSGAAAPGWSLSGRKLGPIGTVVGDGAGGILYSWTEGGYNLLQLPPPRASIKVVRLDASGERRPGWQEIGNPVCSEQGFQMPGTIVRDGAGGAFVGWQDWRTNEPVLYTTHLDASGAVPRGWPVTGSIAAPAAVGVNELAVVDAGGGHAIMVWVDGRHGSRDVFAEVVEPGPPGPPKPLADVYDGSAQFGIAQMRPNPTSGTFWAIIGMQEGGHATLELFDIAGRIVEEQAVDPVGPARGAVRFNAARRMAPGVYWLRLRQGPRSATARVVVAD